MCVSIIQTLLSVFISVYDHLFARWSSHEWRVCVKTTVAAHSVSWRNSGHLS